MLRHPSKLLPLILLAACATSTVDMAEPRRLVGTEDSVRLDAEIRAEELRPGTAVPIAYEITNQRPVAIAVADIVPESFYDQETRTITVNLGSEVPGQSLLPRLIVIQPGERKSFTTAAKVAFAPVASADPARAYPSAIRLKLNFLRDAAPFAELTGMTQKAVLDPERADELFPLWVESNEAVYTNAVPVRWVASNGGADASRRSPDRTW